MTSRKLTNIKRLWSKVSSKKTTRKESGDANKGQDIYSNIFKNRHTRIFLDDEEERHSEILISYEKMRIMMNKHHPRIYDENNHEAKKIKLYEDIGTLRNTSKDKHYIMDKLGIGISIYFKLLKAIVRVFVVLIVLMLPLFYIYSCGDSKKDPSTSMYMSTMLGNLGESNLNCK